MDVIISLGATDSKIILSGSAFGNSFKLLDAEKNMPGSSVAEIPVALTYQQVIKLSSYLMYAIFDGILKTFVLF